MLEIKNLSIDFLSSDKNIQVLQNVNLSISESESVGLVGESGSGKSVTSLATMGLLSGNAKILSGEILFHNKDLLKISENEKNKLRGPEISMIFQDPMNALNPCFTIENHFLEVFKYHTNLSKITIHEKIIETLQMVGIPDPHTKLKSYGHELSGGLAQRVMIALAICLRPKLLIADEPTTALDVTIQAQILTLLRKLKKELKMSVLLISHDMGVIAQNTEQINVMYAGQIVESGTSEQIIQNPKHPYTRALLKCLPSKFDKFTQTELPSIPGSLPNLKNRPKGCQFKSRCDYQKSECEQNYKYSELGTVKCLFSDSQLR